MPRKPRTLPGTVTVVDPVVVGQRAVCNGTAPVGMTSVALRWIDLDGNAGTYFNGTTVRPDGSFSGQTHNPINAPGDWLLSVFDDSVAPARLIAEDGFTVVA